MAVYNNGYIELTGDEATVANGYLNVVGASLEGNAVVFPGVDPGVCLHEFPVLFNGEALFQPESWEESSEVVESVNQTEAGTDQVIVTRYDKLTVSTSFKCSSRWAKKLKTYSQLDTIAVSIYDLIAEAYRVRTMRIRDFRAKVIDNSYYTRMSTGLWDVSFTLKEF